MVEITFKLIRSKNPTLDVDNLDSCQAIDLSGSEVDEIDNLELFAHLQEINLSHNNISKVENLTFFRKLEFLDVSSNQIDVDGLLQSYKGIPPSLTTINLSGNPCVEDENALGDFQDTFPNLNIIIDVINDNGSLVGSVEADDVPNTDDNKADYETIAEIAPGPITSDSVLKYIVDRKCKLQSLSDGFSLESTVEALNSEFATAVEEREVKISTRRKQHENDGEIVDITLKSIKERTEELLERNNAERAKFSEFMKRLRETTEKHKQSLGSVAIVAAGESGGGGNDGDETKSNSEYVGSK